MQYESNSFNFFLRKCLENTTEKTQKAFLLSSFFLFFANVHPERSEKISQYRELQKAKQSVKETHVCLVSF